MKKAYRIYRQRGYRLRLLSAAFRNHLHWSEFIGGDVVISPPFELAEALQPIRCGSEAAHGQPGADPRSSRSSSKSSRTSAGPTRRTGLTPAEFDTFGATRRTLRQFSKAIDDLGALIRNSLISNPDL